MKTRYEIREAFGPEDHLDPRISDCYVDSKVLDAKTDDEALAEAERLQQAHDAAARAVLDKARSRKRLTPALQRSYDRAPWYMNHLFRITWDENDVQIVRL